jgi:hypothetical protein
MKICIYSPLSSFFIGGGENYSIYQSKYLAKAGYDVEMAVLKVPGNFMRPGFEKNLNEANVKIEYLSSRALEYFSFENKDLSNYDNVYQTYRVLSRPFIDLCLKEKYKLVITHFTSGNFYVPQSIKLFSMIQTQQQ